jgi:hypothetical protein
MENDAGSASNGQQGTNVPGYSSKVPVQCILEALEDLRSVSDCGEPANLSVGQILVHTQSICVLQQKMCHPMQDMSILTIVLCI